MPKKAKSGKGKGKGKKTKPVEKTETSKDKFKHAVEKYNEYKNKHPNSDKKVADFVKAEFNK